MVRFGFLDSFVIVDGLIVDNGIKETHDDDIDQITFCCDWTGMTTNETKSMNQFVKRYVMGITLS